MGLDRERDLNFAPRVGFAYDVKGDGRLSIHGGYGIFYFPDYGGINNQLGQNGPFSGNNYFLASNGYCITLSGQTATRQAPNSCASYTSPAAVTSPLPLPATTATFNPVNPPANIGVTAINVNNQHSLQQYNFQLQQQFGPRDVFSAAYVGTYGDRLSTFYNLTQHHIGARTLPYANQDGGITYNHYDGSSNYNGLHLHYEHRDKNLLVTGSYAWSHALDNTNSPYGGTLWPFCWTTINPPTTVTPARMSGISSVRPLSTACRLERVNGLAVAQTEHWTC